MKPIHLLAAIAGLLGARGLVVGPLPTWDEPIDPEAEKAQRRAARATHRRRRRSGKKRRP